MIQDIDKNISISIKYDLRKYQKACKLLKQEGHIKSDFMKNYIETEMNWLRIARECLRSMGSKNKML